MYVVKNGTVVDEIDEPKTISTNTKGTIFHVWSGKAPSKTYVHVRNSKKGYREAEMFLIGLYGGIRMDISTSVSMKATEIAYQF